MTKICFIGDIHGKVKSPSNYLSDYNNDLFNQLQWIKNYCESNNINYIIHLGDIFDKPEATDEWKNRFIEQWRDYKGTFYSIIGAAHDLFFNQANSYDRTCLKNLELANVIKVIDSISFDIGTVRIHSLSTFLSNAKEQLKTLQYDDTRDNIIVAHQFYEWGLDKNAGFTERDFDSLTTSVSLILGHDHHQYETLYNGYLSVYRPGSLMRTELSESTINMIPRVLIYDNGIFNYINVPCKDINDVYNVSEYRVKKSKIFKEIKNNIKDIANYINKPNDVLLCSTFLKETECPTEEFDYLKTVHQVSGVEF